MNINIIIISKRRCLTDFKYSAHMAQTRLLSFCVDSKLTKNHFKSLLVAVIEIINGKPNIQSLFFLLSQN